MESEELYHCWPWELRYIALHCNSAFTFILGDVGCSLNVKFFFNKCIEHSPSLRMPRMCLAPVVATYAVSICLVSLVAQGSTEASPQGGATLLKLDATQGWRRKFHQFTTLRHHQQLCPCHLCFADVFSAKFKPKTTQRNLRIELQYVATQMPQEHPSKLNQQVPTLTPSRGCKSHRDKTKLNQL